MKYIGEISGRLKAIKFELLIEWSFFFIFMVFLLRANTYSNLFFHTAIELFINVIFLLVFVFAFNTYSINKNNFILILGTGYFFVAIVGIFHLLSYPGMPFLNIMESIGITTQLWTASGYIGVFTCLISVTFILKPHKKIIPYSLFITYLCITIFLLSSILIIKIFPICYISNQGLTPFKVISEYIIAFIFIVTAIIYFRLRKRVDKYLFICLEHFLIMSAIAEICFTHFLAVSDWSNIIGHIIKVIAAYFLYKGVVEAGLRRPYNLINKYLDIAGNKVKEFEEVIIKNELCSKMLIENSDNAIFVISDNKLVLANSKMAELLGAENVEDIMGTDVDIIMVDEIRYSAYQRINNVIYSKGCIPFTETKFIRFDGKVIDVEVTDCFCMYQGKPSVMAMFRDIAPQKKIQSLENNILENKRLINKTTELNKAMTEFFSNISHELKTPLNVILGAVQILSLQTKDVYSNSAELRSIKYLNTIKQNCYRLVRLVNNLIDISKFDSGYYKVDLHNHNVVSVVEDITLSVSDYAKNSGVDLIFDTDIEEKEMAVDLDKIERVILNLLSNAIKFTDEGGQILVSLWDKKDKIQISIKDNGIGMPQDKLDMIFERFGQVEKTLIRNKEGSGIGLSLVKSIIDMHGGNIKVLSEYGMGSEFIIELPVRLVEEEEIFNGRIESKVEKISIEFSDIYS